MIAKSDPSKQPPSAPLVLWAWRGVVAALFGGLMLWGWSLWSPSSSSSSLNANEALVSFDQAVSEQSVSQQFQAALEDLGGAPWPLPHLGETKSTQGTWAVASGANKIWVNTRDKNWLLQKPDPGVWDEQINAWRAQAIGSWKWPIARQRASYPGGSTANTITVFVTAQCQLCEAWMARWPGDIPVRWIPVLSPKDPVDPATALWATQWCRQDFDSSTNTGQCYKVLQRQYVQMEQLGVWGSPVGVSAQGVALTGWPDRDWLLSWWDRSGYHWSTPIASSEKDI